MKRIVSMALGIMLASMFFNMITVASSDFSRSDEVETDFASYNFDSLSELEVFIKKNKKAGAKPKYVMDTYLFSTTSIFIPEFLIQKQDIIKKINVNPTYCEVTYDRNKVEYRFGYYHDQAGGQFSYNSAKKKYDNKVASTNPRKFTVGEYVVYSYCISKQTFYIWKQDSKYYFLAINSSETQDGQFAMCKAYPIKIDGTSAIDKEKIWKISMRTKVVSTNTDSVVVTINSPDKATVQKGDRVESLQELPITNRTIFLDKNGHAIKVSDVSSKQEVKITFTYRFSQSRKMIPLECLKIEV